MGSRRERREEERGGEEERMRRSRPAIQRFDRKELKETKAPPPHERLLCASTISLRPLREPSYLFSLANPVEQSAAEVTVTDSASASPTRRTAAT